MAKSTAKASTNTDQIITTTETGHSTRKTAKASTTTRKDYTMASGSKTKSTDKVR